MSKNIQLSRNREVVQKSSRLYIADAIQKSSERHENVKRFPIMRIMYFFKEVSTGQGRTVVAEVYAFICTFLKIPHIPFVSAYNLDNCHNHLP